MYFHISSFLRLAFVNIISKVSSLRSTLGTSTQLRTTKYVEGNTFHNVYTGKGKYQYESFSLYDISESDN